MKALKFTPFILGMIFSVQAICQVEVSAPVNIITQPIIIKAIPLTNQTLVAKSKGVLVDHSLLNFLNELLRLAEAEGMQRDWFVDDQVAALLNEYAQSNNQEELRKIFYTVARKLLSSLNGGYIQPESLGDKTSVKVFAKIEKTSTQRLRRISGSKKYTLEELRKVITDEVYRCEAELTTKGVDVLAAELIEKFRPKNANYKKLLAMYQNISNLYVEGKITDAEVPPPSKRFIVGPRGPYFTDRKNNPETYAADYKAAIAFVRKRLDLFGYKNDTTVDTYSDDLKAAIIDFQDNNLLGRDGVIGSESFGVLTKPIELIMTVLKINLDRSRWLPDQLGSQVPVGAEELRASEYVHVNLAAQRFFYYKNDLVTESFKTINGEKDRPTAIMTSNFTHMILNPTWTVAPTPYFKDKLITFSQEYGLYDFIYKNYTIKDPILNLIAEYPEAEPIVAFLTENQNPIDKVVNVYSEESFMLLTEEYKAAMIQEKMAAISISKKKTLIKEKMDTLTDDEVKAVLTEEQKALLSEKEKVNLTEEQKAVLTQEEILAFVTKEKVIAILTDEQVAMLTDELIKLDLMKELRAEVLSQDEKNKANWQILMKLFSLERARYLVLSGQRPDPLTGSYLPPTKADSIPKALTIVQRPDGNLNALGWIKFPLANTGSVFMHDTNDRKLFKDKNRLLSSGCIRLEKPFEIAAVLLAGAPNAAASGTTTYSVQYLKSLTVKRFPIATVEDPKLSLGRNVPVYLLYDTAQINDHGQMTLVTDHYGVDFDMYNLMMGQPTQMQLLQQQQAAAAAASVTTVVTQEQPAAVSGAEVVMPITQ